LFDGESMVLKNLIFFFFLITSASAFAKINVFFNQNPKSSYNDPYRNMSRPGDNLEEVMIREVNQAKTSIYVAVQEFRLPLLAQALIKKMKEGVDVRIVLEHDYNFNVLGQKDMASDVEGEYEASKLAELKAFGDINKDGQFQESELRDRDAIYMFQKEKVPLLDDTSDLSSGSGLMHHKFIVIDNKTTIITTANFTMSCVHGDVTAPASRGNANSLVVLNSKEIAATFEEEFSQLWGNGKNGKFGQNKTFRKAVTFNVQNSRVTVQFSPTSRRNKWEESVNGLIASHLARAQTSIKAALFVFSEQKLVDVMEEQNDKGVSVGVIVEPKFAYRDYSEVLDILGLQMLNAKCKYEENNRPWVNPSMEAGRSSSPTGDVLHHKFGVIDNKTVIVGSHNWSDSANATNDETLIVIEDYKIGDSFAQEYSRVKASASLGVTPQLASQIKKQEGLCKTVPLE